jgi:hypothetical protein
MPISDLPGTGPDVHPANAAGRLFLPTGYIMRPSIRPYRNGTSPVEF